jgi:hypothetical protein
MIALAPNWTESSLISWLLVPIGDTTSREIVRSQLNLNPVAGEDSDVVHAHLPGNVRQHFVPVLQFNAEHCVGQRLNDRAFENDCIFLGFRQG